jgi:hypothetical protein
MNAIQFIKDYGVDKAREVVATCHKIPNYTFKKKTERGYSSCKSVDISDLKRLVASVERIDGCGGLHGFKTYCNGDFSQEDLQVIADYESIYSNDMGDDTHIENHVSPNCKVGVK